MSLMTIKFRKLRESVPFKFILWPFWEWEKERKTRCHNKQHCPEERRNQIRVCEFGGFDFDFTYNHSLKRIEVVFFVWMEIWALWDVHFVVFVWVWTTRRNTRKREYHDDDDDDRIKEEANEDAFIFEFTHYWSWTSMKVVFFPNAGVVVICNVVEKECGHHDTTCDMSKSITTTTTIMTTTPLQSTGNDLPNENTTIVRRCWYAWWVWSSSRFSFVTFRSISYPYSTFDWQYDSTIK